MNRRPNRTTLIEIQAPEQYLREDNYANRFFYNLYLVLGVGAEKAPVQGAPAKPKAKARTS